MPNPLQLGGAQPPRQQRKGILYQGARWTSGLFTNRSPIRDAASTRLEEKFYGPRGDAFLGGENIEISNRMTLIRRYGNSVWNNNSWKNVNSFSEFRLFNSNTEQIKVMVDCEDGLYDASNNQKNLVWAKSPYSGQSYLQSVGNVLFWGDGANQKKWINTLLTREPYSEVLQKIAQVGSDYTYVLNPYNFTPFALNSFIIDTNGNAQQLIGTVVQLNSFYIYNSTFVFSMEATDTNGNPLPTSSQVLSPGLQIYFPNTSAIPPILGLTDVTLTVSEIVGKISSASVYLGGSGYAVNDVVDVNQTTPAGSLSGQVKVLTVGTSAGTGYVTASGVSTTSNGSGSGATLNITASGGGLVSATVATGGTGYAVGDFIFPQQVGATGGYFKVTTVSVGAVTGVALCTGVAKTISVQTAGDGYYSAEDVPTTGGTGSGLTVNITDDGTQFSCSYSFNGGPITAATATTSGTGYKVGDFVYPVVPTQSTASGGKLTVASIFGTPSTLTLGYGGPTFSGYTVASGLATTTSGTGSGCTFNILTVSSGQIATYSLGSSGTGYAVGDSLFPVQATGAGAQYSVTGIFGPVASVSLTDGGPSFTGYTVASDLPTTTSGGGTGCLFDILSVNGSGQISTFSVGSSGGSGYAVNDLIYPTQPSGAGAVFKVATLTGSAVATMTVVNPGYLPYTTGSNLPTTTSGSGTGATLNITTVSGSQITAGSINAAGSGYAIGDKLYPTESGTSGTAYFTVTALTNSTGGIASVSQVNPGYLPYTTGTVPTNTSGTGTGATIDITSVTSGSITAGTLGTPGSGYKVGDKLYPLESGTSGNAYFTVSSLTSAAGGIATLTVTDGGKNYFSSTGVATTTSGTGSGAILTLVADPNYYPPTANTEIRNVYSGGNPISSYTPNDEIYWNPDVNGETIDGSALWINRGPATDGGLVENWGMSGGNEAPTVVINGASGSWEPNTYYNRWQIIVVEISSSYYIQQLVTSGKSANSAPAWSTIPGQITNDGTAQWICLSNDSDTSLTWASETKYTPGHILQETVSSVPCIFQLQGYSGILTQGSSFPAYCWQCNSQSGSDIGAAGELPNGTSGNTVMAQDGGQTTSTATYTGTANSLFLSAQGGSNPVKTFAISGDGTVSGTGTTLFPGTENLSISLFPTFIIPKAGTYTFTIGHQCAMFWGIGNGSIELTVTQLQLQGGVLTVTCNKNIDTLITPGIDLTFNGLVNAIWLNGVTVNVSSVNGNKFTASVSHSNYGPASDTGTAASGNTLTPSVISGPMVWINPGSTPNVYNFSTGTPVKGYPIMSANYPNHGNSMVVDTVQINFPSAGVYPVEIQHGVWYHSTSGYSAPTVSPALPGTTFSFYMVYTPPDGSTTYNIIPEDIACSNSSAPTWPSWGATVADLQAVAPNYPSVTEASGNYTWWNLGPSTTFGWNASVNQTTATFIIDTNSNEEIPYEAGVSGTAQPTFSTTLYGLTSDLPNLVWMNNGQIGNTPQGSLTTTQGGWKYCVAVVNTLDDAVSNASLISASTGDFFEASGIFVSGGLPAYIDPQADYVAIFRTKDGGSTYYLVPPPASGNGNTEYTVPLSTYVTQGFTDTTADSDLETLLQAPLAYENTPPTQGSINCVFHKNRIFVAVANTLKWSTGPDTPIGNGYNGFSPNNYAEFPSLIKRMVPLNIGLMVFTVSDIYILVGDGTANNPFASYPFIERTGLLSYNGLSVNGSVIYMMTTDNQIVEVNMNRVDQIGFPIADLLDELDPSSAYLAWHIKGSYDQCLFVADGSTGWYRLAPTSPPEPVSLTWSPKANIIGGCGAVGSIEVSPGDIQLLVAPPLGTSGPILFRDYTQFSDNGTPYSANFILGSLVFAFPGQVAAPEFITTECVRLPNSRPFSLGVRIGEITGEFENLVFWTNDPPQLPPSESMYNQRFYFSQTKQSVLCRHAQIFGEFAATNTADELMTLTLVGGYMLEE